MANVLTRRTPAVVQLVQKTWGPFNKSRNDKIENVVFNFGHQSLGHFKISIHTLHQNFSQKWEKWLN